MGVQSKYISGEANNHISAEDCLHLKPVDTPDHIRVKALLAHEDLASSENNKSTGVVMNSFAEERPVSSCYLFILNFCELCSVSFCLPTYGFLATWVRALCLLPNQ